MTTQPLIRPRLAGWPLSQGVRADVAVFAAVAALQLWLSFWHTPGRDELQAWLIAGASHTPAELLNNMRNEGHPLLWHGLLMLVQALTGSTAPTVLTTLQLGIAWATSAVIIFHAPFPLWLRALVAANVFIAFEYGTMARAYGLGMLATLLYARARSSPWAWLWLAVLPQISLHFALLAGVLAVWHYLERDRSYRGFASVVASGLLALWLMWPDPSTVAAAPNVDIEGKFLTALVNLGSLLVPLSNFGGWPFLGVGSGQTWIPLNLLGCVVSVAMLWPLLGHSRRALPLGGLLLASLFAISVGVFYCFARHYGVVILFVIVIAWQHWQIPAFGRRAFVGLSAWLACVTLVIAAASPVVPFTRHQQAAATIVALGLGDAPWAAYPPHVQIEPAAWLQRPIYDLLKAERLAFPRWTYPDVPAVDSAAFAEIVVRAVAAHSGELNLILQGAPLPSIAGLSVLELKTFERAVYSDTIRLYRLRQAPRP